MDITDSVPDVHWGSTTRLYTTRLTFVRNTRQPNCDNADHVSSTGTQNGGNMFPGAVRPFGVVKLGPDLSYQNTDAYSGYLPSGNVTGYSLTHESGTGGAPKYGVVSQLPVVGNIANPLIDLSLPRASDDQATVGYYQSTLTSGVKTELAATEHAGLFQYTFPTNEQANVVVDVSHVLPSFRGLGLGQNYTGGSIQIAKDGHYEGSGIYNNGWNLGEHR